MKKLKNQKSTLRKKSSRETKLNGNIRNSRYGKDRLNRKSIPVMRKNLRKLRNRNINQEHPEPEIKPREIKPEVKPVKEQVKPVTKIPEPPKPDVTSREPKPEIKVREPKPELKTEPVKEQAKIQAKPEIKAQVILEVKPQA